MMQLLRRWDSAWAGLVLVLAVTSLAVAWLLTRWRVGRAVPSDRAWRLSLAETAMVAGTVPWLVLMAAPITLPLDARHFYLIPFDDLWQQLTGPPGEAVVQIVGNLLVLFCFGAGGAVRFRALAGPWRLLLAGAACSLLLEALQLLTASGRVFSVDDVLVNAVGALLGGLVTRRWWARDPAPGMAGVPA
jgi:hypothetical protein